MIKIPYLKKLWDDQKFVLLWLGLFAFAFQFSFAWLLFEVDFHAIFESVAIKLPQSLMNFIGVTAGSQIYGSQLLAFGYSHPLILISLSLLPIGLPARYIAGEVEHKTMDLLMARSIHRSVIPTHLYIFLIFAMAVQAACLFTGTVAGYFLFDLQIELFGYLRVTFLNFLFFLSMGAAAMAITVFQNERGKAIARTVSLFVIFYFFDTIIRLNQSLEYLTAYSYFNLYQPGKLLQGQLNLGSSSLILLTIILVFLFVSIWRFNRRDL
jgi:ABC-type transport system involved in multi-copper enzyme maturation permease subunit